MLLNVISINYSVFIYYPKNIRVISFSGNNSPSESIFLHLNIRSHKRNYDLQIIIIFILYSNGTRFTKEIQLYIHTKRIYNSIIIILYN